MKEREINAKINQIKKELISKYILFLSFIFLIFSLIYTFFIKDKFLAYYISIGFLFLIYTWNIIRTRFSIEKTVHNFFILYPLYVSYLILRYWEVTMVNFLYIIIIPLGAFVFFGRREIIAYTIYAFSIIVILFVIVHASLIEIVHYKRQSFTDITDLIVIVFNMLTITLALYYKDKIRTLRSMAEIAKVKEAIIVSDIFDQKSIERYEELFAKIEQTINLNGHFKDPDFNLTDLSSKMKINNGYLSKAIRHKGFTNFNHYLNYHRIDFAKKLIAEADLKKITIMYIYSEAGFGSQSTFNRVFKNIEGITPSQYIDKIVKESEN
ncbi:AraC family transcriptional regulator [Chryseobacterium gambrini]|uniref:AraC family transcriptional regulator n=1 Tax=Chryseobacterium gambrini TaxID=373672 RepID=A0AAJ1R3R8_9FLAO|nr:MULTISPECIES: AraC family transcriptional regulator [Chryseobacterium]MDN4013436.1 AraC family transcriptional regulator [Chryseobacterium gambrini]QWA37806.1 AraC family transcriptional regulator [Chryseobacterium sp. ZHDP1]